MGDDLTTLARKYRAARATQLAALEEYRRANERLNAANREESRLAGKLLLRASQG